jgi:hypothetical protein
MFCTLISHQIPTLNHAVALHEQYEEFVVVIFAILAVYMYPLKVTHALLE